MSNLLEQVKALPPDQLEQLMKHFPAMQQSLAAHSASASSAATPAAQVAPEGLDMDDLFEGMLAVATPSLKAFSKRSRSHTIRLARHPARTRTFPERKPEISCKSLVTPCRILANPDRILAGSLWDPCGLSPSEFSGISGCKKVRKQMKTVCCHAFVAVGHHQNPLEPPRIIFVEIPQGSRKDSASSLAFLAGFIGSLADLVGFLGGFVCFLQDLWLSLFVNVRNLYGFGSAERTRECPGQKECPVLSLRRRRPQK
jgi:hypothetical protein